MPHGYKSNPAQAAKARRLAGSAPGGAQRDEMPNQQSRTGVVQDLHDLGRRGAERTRCFFHTALFLLLAFLCYEAHQLVRHIVGAALCGGFGSMTFTVSTTRAPCAFPTLLILSGPMLTYGLAYLGMFLLRSPEYALFGYGLVFASFSHLRFIQTLTGRGDELILAQEWFGVTSHMIVAAIVFLIGVPPLLAAFHVIANRRRMLVFVCSWLLPLPILFALLFGNEFLFGARGGGWQLGEFLGISLIVLMTDLAACALFMLLAPRYLRPTEEA